MLEEKLAEYKVPFTILNSGEALDKILEELGIRRY